MTTLPLKMSAAVKDFMDAFHQKCYHNIGSVPCEVCALRSALIKEEYDEYTNSAPHSIDELDAICDLLYVVIGTNLALATPTFDYRSGQFPLKGRPIKHNIFEWIIPMRQDLDCKFPCAKIQTKTSNALISRLIDIGIFQNYRLEAAFNEVHRSNMAKLGGSKRTDGKILKPPTWTPPNLAPYVNS